MPKLKNKEKYLKWNANVSIIEDANKYQNKLKKINVLFIVIFMALTFSSIAISRIEISVEIQGDENETFAQKQLDTNNLVAQKPAGKEESHSVAPVAEIEPAAITSPKAGSHEYSSKLSPVLPSPIPTLTDIIKKVKKGVVMIGSGNSLGSGFIISPNGKIITNSHVVGKNSEVRIKLSSGESYVGRVLKKGVPPLDIALLKINIADYSDYLTLNKHSPCQVGAEVLAIGQPHGLKYTVTKGIVSNCDLAEPNFHKIKYIQTDTAISPGNSGGPLINNQGEVLGVNTLILSNSESIGFAIEIDTVKGFIQNKLTKLEADLQKIEEAKLQIEEERLQKSIKELVLYFNDVWNLELLNYMRAAHQRLEMEATRGTHFNFRARYNAMIEEKKMPPAGSGFYDLQGWFEALADQSVIGDLTVDQATENIKKHLF